MGNINWIVKKLKESGYKKTSTRDEVSSWLATHCGVFSAEMILEALPDLDKVSLYRTLETLVSLDIVHPVAVDGQSQYYELHGEDHHHHRVCPSCHDSSCVPCPIETEKKSEHHSLLFTAPCSAHRVAHA